VNNKTFSEKKYLLKIAQEHHLLAEVALAKRNWRNAKDQAQKALQVLSSQHNRENILHSSTLNPCELTEYLFLKSSCFFILAQAQEQLNEFIAAINNLEAAKQIGITENIPFLYISILNSLRRLYKQQKQYLEATHTKLEQRSIEQKYGLRIFIGAGSLEAIQQPKLVTTVEKQLITSQQENIAPEITASSRQKDVEQLLERIGSENNKLIIIYGKSGVGKTSLLNAGLIPALKKTAIATQDNLVVQIRVYRNWIEELTHQIEEEARKSATTQDTETQNQENGKNQALNSEVEISTSEVKTSTSKLDSSTLEIKTLALELASLTSEIEILTCEFDSLNSELETFTPEPQSFTISPSHTLPQFHFLLEQLRQNEQHNLRTVLIFDQFEEFFFIHTLSEPRRQFFEFLGECLNILSVKVILSLRENYLHHLLTYNDLPSMEIINKDILSKNILYKLGNLLPTDAKKIIECLTTGTRFQLEPALLEQLIQDLAGKLGEVHPIDLQIVGVQLQTENITTLAEYQQYGEQAQEKLIQHYLNEVIEDCGIENQQLAKLILYLLTDEKGTCPLKTRAELEQDLQQYSIRDRNTEKFLLDLVLQILVKSGIVILLRENPTVRYQLAHEHLVTFIRQQQQPKLKQLTALQERKTDLNAVNETIFDPFFKHILVGSFAAGFVFAVMAVIAFDATKHKHTELSEIYLIQGEKLAREGNFEGAVKHFRKAQKWNSDLKFNSKAKALEFVNKAKAELLFVEGQQRLETNELESAVTKFQEALKLNTQIGRLAAPVLIYEGNKFMKKGKIKKAAIAYINAQNLDPKVEISADAWKELCLQGSLKKQAADVMQACENAVQLAADNQKIRVVRGLARAVSGNKQGAIEDFEAYIAATDSKTGKLKVKAWIKALRIGKNPFTDKKMKRLLGENKGE
jgi:tetratricopeptide (TPR) repeat protein